MSDVKPVDVPSFEDIQEIMTDGSYLGWCVECGEWTHDSAEPDAREYQCPDCEQFTVYGAEECLMRDWVK